MKDVIQICEPGGRILDPFAGAGTTILAAVEEGYETVGITRDTVNAVAAKTLIFLSLFVHLLHK